MQISLVANENEGSDFFTFSLLFATHRFHAGRVHWANMLHSRPGAWGEGYRGGDDRVPTLEKPYENAEERHRAHECECKTGPGEAGFPGEKKSDLSQRGCCDVKRLARKEPSFLAEGTTRKKERACLKWGWQPTTPSRGRCPEPSHDKADGWREQDLDGLGH